VGEQAFYIHEPGDQKVQANKTQTNSHHDMTQLFISALEQLESKGDAGPMLELFADDATLSNVMIETHMKGKEGAQRFWTDYRHSFGDVASKFGRITESEDVIVLEWTSIGSLRTGQPVDYRGCTVLTVSNERIVDFMAYFDSKHLTAHLHQG